MHESQGCGWSKFFWQTTLKKRVPNSRFDSLTSDVTFVVVRVDNRRFTFSNSGLIGGKSHVQLVSFSIIKVYDGEVRRVADCTCGSDEWRLDMPGSLLQSLPVPDDGGLSQAYVR